MYEIWLTLRLKHSLKINSFNDLLITLTSLLNLRDFSFFENGIKFLTFNSSLNNITMFISCDDSDFELLSVGSSVVHWLAEDFSSQNKGFLERAFLLIVGLEGWDSVNTAFSCGMGLPWTVVSRGIWTIELESSNCIITCIHERNTEWAAATELSVSVLIIAKILDQLFHIVGLFMWIEMSLALETTIINEEVGISNNTRNWAKNMFIHLVELSWLSSGDEKLRVFLLLSSQDNAYIFNELLYLFFLRLFSPCIIWLTYHP
jgi:hypothetical protein